MSATEHSGYATRGCWVTEIKISPLILAALRDYSALPVSWLVFINQVKECIVVTRQPKEMSGIRLAAVSRTTN